MPIDYRLRTRARGNEQGGSAAFRSYILRIAEKRLTVRLDSTDYERLEETADLLSMRPGTLAKVLLHASLTGARTASPGNRVRALAALARLRQMAAGLPPVDAVAIAAAARRALDARASLSRGGRRRCQPACRHGLRRGSRTNGECASTIGHSQ
jgi:hypothetical protein